MRFNPKYFHRFVLVGGTLVALSLTPSGAWAQQNGDQSTAQVQTQAQGQFQAQDIHAADWTAFDQFLDAHPDVADALRANPDLIYDQNFLGQHSDLKDFCDAHPGLRQDMDRNRGQFADWFRTRRELATMDRFLSTHPDIEKQLEANPKLLDDESYTRNHPELLDFLNNNRTVRDAFDRNPALFMSLEERFQARLSDHSGVGPAGNPGDGYDRNPNPEQRELAATKQFFDSHPDIEKQMQSSPDLINSQSFLQQHPELQDFLNSHPQVQAQFDASPTAFLNAEIRFQGGPSVVSMDEFLNAHPEVAKQLEANPSLINNPKYLNDHPELRNVLNDNPQLRDSFVQNPSNFLKVAYRDDGIQGQGNGSADVATMDTYLDKHKDEARDLNAYPARVNDSDYLAHHKDLEAFLKKHPDVREEFTHNPSAFMHQESTFDACAQMDDFLNSHKNVGKDLQENPDRVKDADYLDHHKGLKGFFAKNPGVSDQFQNNPSGFMDHEKRFEADREMDVYLSNHKNVSKDLQKNPDNVKDANYLDHHKDLKELMDKNPELAQAAENNPSGFMQEQMKFHEDYKNQHMQQKTTAEERASIHGAQ
ncbi:MAG: hemophore-related protein [Candidatus Acidiferrales bacterium]